MRGRPGVKHHYHHAMYKPVSEGVGLGCWAWGAGRGVLGVGCWAWGVEGKVKGIMLWAAGLKSKFHIPVRVLWVTSHTTIHFLSTPAPVAVKRVLHGKSSRD